MPSSSLLFKCVARCVITLAIVTSSCCQGDQVPETGECLSVNQTRLFCLDRGSNSSSFPVQLTLSCPSSFQVLVLKAIAYENPSPLQSDICNSSSIHNPSSTFCSYVISGTYQCRQNTCDIIVPRSSLDGTCGEGQGSRSSLRYVYVIYRCQPVFSQFSNASGTAISIDSDAVVSNPLIAINSDTLALTGDYITQSSSFCSAIIPPNTEAIVRLYFMLTKYANGAEGSDGGDRAAPRVDMSVLDGPDANCLVISSFYSDKDAQQVLGCWPTERYLKITFSNDNPSASVIFVLHIQVSHLSKITMQCGHPSFPLSLVSPNPPSSSSPPSSSVRPSDLDLPRGEEGSTRPSRSDSSGDLPLTTLAIALSCGLGGLVLAIGIIIFVVVAWYRTKRGSVRHRPLSETSSVSSSISNSKLQLSVQVETESKIETVKA